MIIYGVCISYIKNINEGKAEQFLESLINTSAKDIAENFFVNKKDNEEINGEKYTVEEWLSYYDSCESIGLSGFLRDIISELEGLSISSDEPNGIQYLGISADVPWNMTERTRNISEEEYKDILKKYINQITDDELEIRWWNVNDDCDW